MIDVMAEKRGAKVCLFAKLTLTDGNESTVLTGGQIPFTVAAVGNTKSVSGTRSVDPFLMLSPTDACRMARQILADNPDG